MEPYGHNHRRNMLHYLIAALMPNREEAVEYLMTEWGLNEPTPLQPTTRPTHAAQRWVDSRNRKGNRTR